MRALLLVDIQNDFLPGGALAVPDGDEVVPVANQLMPLYSYVVATQDYHPQNHLSFASQHPGKQVGEHIELHGLDQILWPDHCVAGTLGADFVKSLNTQGIHHVIRKGEQRELDSYSGFFDNARRASTGLETLLRELQVTSVDVMGLATDYCVKFTALDAVDLGFSTRVIQDGVRGVNLHPGDDEQALSDMREAGAELVRWRDLIPS